MDELAETIRYTSVCPNFAKQWTNCDLERGKDCFTLMLVFGSPYLF